MEHNENRMTMSLRFNDKIDSQE